MHYHLSEWGHANVQYVAFFLLNINVIFSIYSPANKEELFNLHHASAHNVIEHIFGVLKCRFQIFILPPAYSPELQAKIPAALCTIHNIIQELDVSEGKLPAENVFFEYLAGNEDTGGNDNRSDARKDRIAEDMCEDYQRILEERGMDEIDEDSQDSYEEEE